jgi:excisionase family DNA binding protein
VTAKEIGAALRLDDKTVLRLARKGRIPAVRLGARVVWFNLDEVLAALDRPRS